MSWIGREALHIELASVVAKDEQTQGAFKRKRATRKALDDLARRNSALSPSTE
jgi:hypothetical protein